MGGPVRPVVAGVERRARQVDRDSLPGRNHGRDDRRRNRKGHRAKVGAGRLYENTQPFDRLSHTPRPLQYSGRAADRRGCRRIQQRRTVYHDPGHAVPRRNHRRPADPRRQEHNPEKELPRRRALPGRRQ